MLIEYRAAISSLIYRKANPSNFYHMSYGTMTITDPVIIALIRDDSFQRLGPRDVRGEDVDLGPFPDSGPVRTGQRNLLIVIENRDLHAPTLSVPPVRLATVSS